MFRFDLRLWPGFSFAGGDVSRPAYVDQIAIDSREIFSSNALFVALPGKVDDGHVFISHAISMGVRYILVNTTKFNGEIQEGVTVLRVKDPLKVYQELARIYRIQSRVKVIAITGSYGKTILKDLLVSMLQEKYSVAYSPESFNSQIGVPISLFTTRKEDSFAVIEAGVSKPGEMTVLANMILPDYAILTNIGKAHLAGMQSLQTTLEEKMILLKRVPRGNWVLLPSSETLCFCREEFPRNFCFWDKYNSCFPHAHLSAVEKLDEPHRYTIVFPDKREFENLDCSNSFYFADLINMAIKAAWLLDLSADTIMKVLKKYYLEHMRSEIWKSPSGVTVVNEPYCSHILSFIHALKVLGNTPKRGKKIFFFGGIRERAVDNNRNNKQIARVLSQSSIDLLVLLGKGKFSTLVEEVSLKSPKIKVLQHSNAVQAIDFLQDSLREGDHLLIKGARKEPWEKLSEAFLEGTENNNQLIINLAAIRANIEVIQKHLPKNTKLMGMVKAQAYGTDSVLLSRHLLRWGVDVLGVANVDEAIVLRNAGIEEDIFVFNAASYEVHKVVNRELEVAVSYASFIQALNDEASKQGRCIHVHLHVDTGMSRLGCRPEEAVFLAKKITSSSHLFLKGIMTHFACAENPAEDSFTNSQESCFQRVISSLQACKIDPPYKHAMNSSGAIRFSFSRLNMVRIGLAFLGIHASPATEKVLELRPALALKSRVVGLKTCKRGETISYGRTYTVSSPQEEIAVIPLGYFDGLHRCYSGKGYVFVRGCRVPMVGTICMDFMMLNVTNVPDICIGDRVIIFGEDEYGNYVSPEKFAERAGSNVYELITCLGPRIQRVFINEEKITRID